MLKPGSKAPELEVKTLDGGNWRLSEQRPEQFTMVVFYRGFHCPVCKGYLQQLEQKIEEFQARGVDVIAISGDTQERAERSAEEWELAKVPIGYGQSVESVREWGLFVSHAIEEEEPDLFGEPGLFLIRPDGSVYYESIQSMPFGRPSFRELLGALDFVAKADYPARGEA